MKPQGRIQAAIELLDKINASRIPMDATVGDYMRARRYIGSKDRAYIAELVYDLVRHHARLGWWLEREGLEDAGRNRALLYMILVKGDTIGRFKDLFDGSKFAPEKLEDSEQVLIKSLGGLAIVHKDMPEDVACECPPEYKASLKDYFGSSFAEEMAAMMSPATLDLRVNIFLNDRDSAAKSLAKDGVETLPTPYSSIGLRCVDKAYLSKTKAFHKGLVEIQDEGSQLIAQMCGARAGMQVLDFCAGGGGKTLALAAAMQRKGRIVAMDNDSRRLEKGRVRYKKAGIADIIEVRSLEDEKNRKWLRRQKDKFDIVLLDVPCSGTGTWRRNPDMRWRNFGPGVEELRVVQAEILEKAHGTVKPGGRLVYATCSLLPEENERQIDSFLKSHPEFSIEPVEPTRNIGTPFMRLTPLRHDTDGFFTAILKKNSVS